MTEPIAVLIKSKGSVRLIIRIPQNRTEELLTAIRDGRLADLDVVEARVVEPEPEKERSPDVQQTIVRPAAKPKKTSPKQKSVAKEYKTLGGTPPKRVPTTSKPKAATKRYVVQAGSSGAVATATIVGVKTGSTQRQAKQTAAKRQTLARRASALLRHVSDPTRLQLILTLAGGEKHVGALCAQLSQSQPAISHHLALLRHGGIIAPRRQGKNNFYGLTETGLQLAKVVSTLTEK
jgi:DNA-binding transcriptional ArsR family regulator